MENVGSDKDGIVVQKYDREQTKEVRDKSITSKNYVEKEKNSTSQIPQKNSVEQKSNIKTVGAAQVANPQPEEHLGKEELSKESYGAPSAISKGPIEKSNKRPSETSKLKSDELKVAAKDEVNEKDDSNKDVQDSKSLEPNMPYVKLRLPGEKTDKVKSIKPNKDEKANGKANVNNVVKHEVHKITETRSTLSDNPQTVDKSVSLTKSDNVAVRDKTEDGKDKASGKGSADKIKSVMAVLEKVAAVATAAASGVARADLKKSKIPKQSSVEGSVKSDKSINHDSSPVGHDKKVTISEERKVQDKKVNNDSKRTPNSDKDKDKDKKPLRQERQASIGSKSKSGSDSKNTVKGKDVGMSKSVTLDSNDWKVTISSKEDIKVEKDNPQTITITPKIPSSKAEEMPKPPPKSVSVSKDAKPTLKDARSDPIPKPGMYPAARPPRDHKPARYSKFVAAPKIPIDQGDVIQMVIKNEPSETNLGDAAPPALTPSLVGQVCGAPSTLDYVVET